MASIDKRPNGKWRARYRSPDGRQHARHFDRKIDGERWLTTVEHSKLTGDYVDPTAGKATFRSYAEAWRSVQVHRPTTAAQVETNLRRHVYPTLGDRPIAAVRTSEVQALVKALSATLAPGTVELIYRYVAAVFGAAVRDRVITRTPCEGIKLPKAERKLVEPITTEQVYAVRDALPARYQALVILGAGSGLRQGEAFGLTVDRVDFLRGSLVVDRQLVLMPSGPPAFGPPKTEASYRTIPLPRLVTDALSAQLAEHGRGADGLIFTSSNGEPIRRTRFSDAWRPAAKAAGLEPGTGFHALRHYYASALIHHGESVKVVQSRLGHATAAETLDTYSHLWPDSEDRTRAAVELALAPREDSVRTADQG